MISLIIGLVILGVVLYLLTLIPMDPAIQTVIRVVVVLCAVMWLLRAFGVVDMPVPRLR